MTLPAGQLVPDAIGEWWSWPIATAIGDRTVFGAISSTGDVLACEMDHTSGATQRVVLGSVQPDDHNCPALWASAGRRSVAMWTRHTEDNSLHVSVSGPDGSVASMAGSPELLFSAAGATSYAQMHRIAHLSNAGQDTFWVFTRIGTTTWQMVPMSVDQATGAVTFGTMVQLLTATSQTYISTADAFTVTGQTLRVAWGYNPAVGASEVRYFEINVVTGAITSPVDLTLAANISGTGLPLVDTDVAPLLGPVGTGRSRRLFYTRPGPIAPAVAYAEWDEATPDAAEYRIVRSTGGSWVSTSYGLAGPRLGYTSAANYISGMAFPSPCPDDRVAIARYVDGVSTVEVVTADGALTIADTTATRLARPFFPVGRTDRVICSNVSHYGATYEDYYADVIALFEDPTVVVVNETDRVTILCGELRTGRILATLDVSDASWEQVHRDAGSVEVTIPDTVLLRRADLLSYLEGPRCYLAAQRRSTILEAGPIWMWDYEPGQGMKVRAGGLLSYFDHRKVMALFTPGTGFDHRRGVVKWTDRELGTIAVKLVKLAAAHTGGHLPVVYPPERTGANERTWHGYELANLGTELRRLMEVEGGPDIAFRPRLSSDGLRVEWVLRVGTDAAPMLTQDGPDWGWDTAAARGPVTKLAVRRDWSSVMSRAWATGEGFEFSQLMAMQQDSAATAGGFPLLEGHTARSTVSDQATLFRHAGALLAQGRRAWQTWDLTVKADPHLSEYRPGDWGQVTVSGAHPILRPLAGRDRQYRARILRLSGGLSDDVSITLAPMMEDR